MPDAKTLKLSSKLIDNHPLTSYYITTMKNLLLTPEDWSKLSDIEVIDPDGWNRLDFDKDWAKPITFSEFYSKASASTTSNWPSLGYTLLEKAVFEKYAKEHPLPAPVCPYFRTVMREEGFVGYYDAFHHWACECNTLPNAEKNITNGQYA